MEAGQDRGQPILWQYWSGRCSSSPVLLCSGDWLVYCIVTGVEERVRPGAGLVNTGEQELGTGGWSCYTFNEPWPGCSRRTAAASASPSTMGSRRTYSRFLFAHTGFVRVREGGFGITGLPVDIDLYTKISS